MQALSLGHGALRPEVELVEAVAWWVAQSAAGTKERYLEFIKQGFIAV